MIKFIFFDDHLINLYFVEKIYCKDETTITIETAYTRLTEYNGTNKKNNERFNDIMKSIGDVS